MYLRCTQFGYPHIRFIVP